MSGTGFYGSNDYFKKLCVQSLHKNHKNGAPNLQVTHAKFSIFLVAVF